uniref:CDGSH iron-sulfur domain-containing protein 2 homologue n=1 Tax=Cacopsylla melanoneura TaxID=428564 RepID=A0A8D8WUT6_9HEMI
MMWIPIAPLTVILWLDLMPLLTSHDMSGENQFAFYEPCERYINMTSDEYFGTEPRRVLNKHYSKHEDVVTDRLTVDIGLQTFPICRCWKSKDFPFCDNSHKIHNKFHKDNVGPLIIDSPTLPDEVLDLYTRRTPNRSITIPTEPEPSSSEIQRERDRHVAENWYSDESPENSTRPSRIDKNDFFERLRRYPPGLRPKTAPWGWM